MVKFSLLEDLDEHIIAFYQTLLIEEEVSRDHTQNYFPKFIPQIISPTKKFSLTTPISYEEVEKMVFHMKSFESLGSDGFPPGFYQKF